jgi:hypothetical protein
VVSLSFAQNPIPNAGFENWTDEEPDDWITLDYLGFYDAVSRSEISHSGSSAVKGEVVNFENEGVPPYLASSAEYFSITEDFTRLTGYYQFLNNGEDAFWVVVEFFDEQDMFVALGSGEFGETFGGYTQFAVNMDYTSGSGQPAAQAIIWFSIVNSSESQIDTLTLGSYFLLDDLAFDNVSSISDEGIAESTLRTYRLAQNYPNPFNPSTTINFSIPQSGRVNLSIFNSVGQEVETMIDREMTAGNHQITFNADNLPSGIYFYKLEAGNFLDVKKMVMIR